MNKFLILIAVLLLMVNVSSAQTGEGNQTLGVNLGFQFSNSVTNSFSTTPDGVTVTNKYHSYNFGPTYSYFVSNTWALGAMLNYSYSSSDMTSTNPIDNPQKSIFKKYGGEIFLNKYVLYQNKIGFRVGPFAGYGYQLSSNSGQPYAATYDQKTNDYFAGGALDFVYFPTKNLGLSLSIARLTYDHSTSKNSYINDPTGGDSSGHSNNLTFDFINSGTNVSIYYVFGGK